MKDHDFRRLVDCEFAPLEWTDEKRLAALNAMTKEAPRMKKKIVIALALVASIMVLSVTALAVTAGIPGIQQLIDQSDRRTREYDYAPFTVTAEAVVTPANQRHTSRLVDVELHEAFLTREALYLTLHVTPADGAILWEEAAPPTADGQPLTYFDLYRQEGITLLDFDGLTLHSPLNAHDYTVFADYTEIRRDPDGAGFTLLLAYPLPEDEFISLSGATVLGKFAVLDCHTRQHEYNAFLFDLPRMTITEAHDSFLVN